MVNRDAEFILKIIILVGTFLTVMIIATAAWAHAWFDKECCSEQDCRIARPDEVQTRRDGVMVTIPGKVQEAVPYSDKRVRVTRDPENRPAVCVGPQYHPGHSAHLLCVYVPAGGV
jgi:hypothetical protein